MREELRAYFRENRKASIEELSRHFSVGPESIVEHLSPWIESGCIEKKQPDIFSSALFQACSRERGDEVYHWVC
ncbi:hypothetical protein INT08_05870 [Prosthecochloris sp. N3]|uniref:Transcriptional regulator HTH-type FeoC domain-containing protein n=1 Tax=Prosthecochloris ethylica TaxID=2743976 RepID=A0ABR9XS00_9CHLB|nr:MULTISPECIES: FeoC-like transcriptional regulator [Prosthecochloris]MEC9486595.1 FeoC-like transcriptional regulator [Prosthecochloris sp.]MBF0586798.1 hypothetical protein [Prosthecochloris ethylica]MBF0636704.1 hypothetical protein [Prosthecochloris ethylica]NUK47897.1 hypothetical protein [Prosthecochloris ethylica]RNA66513.1 hypothetical protein CR163_000530 [Prosthecochloris sp. ZM_2]